mgnify:CR=1 FL=1|tara:strand:+ start:210 stop:404 length:195 start_codon:yes stop_codon:yes gene_type:complete
MKPRVEGANHTQGRWKEIFEGPENGLWRAFAHGRPQYRGTLGECLEWRDAHREESYTLTQEAKA